MKKEYYRVVAVFDGVKKEDVPVQQNSEGRRIVSMDAKGRAFVACNIDADGYAEPAITLLPRKAKYYQMALSLKERDSVETVIVNKATGDILKPFYVTKEGVAKYAFGQTYLRGPARENWVISVWANGRIVIDDVSLPVRGGKPFLALVTPINETFHVYLGQEFLERELQKLPDYLVQVIGPILTAHQELEKRGQIGANTNTMQTAFKVAFEEEIGKVLGAGKAGK